MQDAVPQAVANDGLGIAVDDEELSTLTREAPDHDLKNKSEHDRAVHREQLTLVPRSFVGEAEAVAVIMLAEERADVPPTLVVADRRQAPRHARKNEDGEDGVSEQGPNCVGLPFKQPLDIGLRFRFGRARATRLRERVAAEDLTQHCLWGISSFGRVCRGVNHPGDVPGKRRVRRSRSFDASPRKSLVLSNT